MTYLTAAIVGMGLLQLLATWRLLRGLRRLDRAESRLGHLTEALRLLAETTEAGFRASGQELSRVAERMAAPAPPAVVAAPAPAPAAARPRVRRQSSPVTKAGRPPIAARPEMSESEVRLRQLLAGSSLAGHGAAKEAGRGTLRA